jgi:hypothetical protein
MYTPGKTQNGGKLRAQLGELNLAPIGTIYIQACFVFELTKL